LERQGERIATLALLDAFYAPGCKPLAWGWMKRWMYHAGQFSKLGPSYLSKKLGKRIKLAKQRRSKWMSMRRVHPAREHSETERLRLPQADFLGQLLRPYKGRPYAGNAVLFRTLAEPNSFVREISPTNGWEKIILGELQREEIECNHTDLSEEPHVIEVASRLRHHLSRSEAISDSTKKIFSNHPVP
jgi:thioesterase domain-containing protein